jgi:BirA family biotin operon repressor/biotin-[acetyl-CoA-carboxylase] ligase
VGRQILPTTDSTMLEAARQAPYLAGPTWICALEQTAARGRRGRVWAMPPGNFAASLVMRPEGAPGHAALRSFVAALALRDALIAVTARPEGLALKWPNDVLVEGGKLAGILCETLPSGKVVAGIGLNIEFQGDNEPVPGSVALAGFVGVTHSLVDSIVCDTLMNVRRWSESVPSDVEAQARALLHPVLATLGQQVSIHEMDGGVWSGTAEGLSPQGHLLVTTPGGDRRVVVASDVRHLRQ